MNHEQLPTELIYPIEIDNTQSLDPWPTIPDIQWTDKTIFTVHIDAGRLNEENTSNTDDDIEGHDSNKENEWPTADTSSTIPCDTSEHEESTQLNDTGCRSTSGPRTEISKSTEQLGEWYEEPLPHTSRSSRDIRQGRKDDEWIFRNLGDSKPLLEFISTLH